MDYTITQLNDMAKKAGNKAGIYIGWKLRVTTTYTSLIVEYDKYQPFGTPGLQMYKRSELEIEV